MTTARSRAAVSVTIVGRGKVGGSLARAAAAAGVAFDHVGSRRLRAVRPAALFVLAVSDAAALEVARALADSGVPPSAVVHTAGLLEANHLAQLRASGWSVGQAHPLVSFASPRSALPAGATVLLGGDRLATSRARAFMVALGLRPFAPRALDRAAWHAVAALVANGAAALVALGASRWEAEGVPPRVASRALASLLASVALNVDRDGAAAALSGPVRRGDPGAIARHLAVLAPPLAPPAAAAHADLAYAALAIVQVPLAKSLGEASPTSLAKIEQLARATLGAASSNVENSVKSKSSMA